ncbi:MAG: hypothetical protein PHF14_13835, partial [Verrucomicrobiota bacterium]|nr:hypothetical protein [Verrucomicrobiota bacterium]
PFDPETDSDPDSDLASPWTFSDGLQLEVIRKGVRFPIQTFPSGSGEPPAEGAVACSTCLWGWVVSMLCTQHFGGSFLYCFNRPRQWPITAPM